tara:strand:+ start:210 stop:428 length:219 start_codon:yes stop_codon:yes gene_type:complete
MVELCWWARNFRVAASLYDFRKVFVTERFLLKVKLLDKLPFLLLFLFVAILVEGLSAFWSSVGDGLVGSPHS